METKIIVISVDELRSVINTEVKKALKEVSENKSTHKIITPTEAGRLLGCSYKKVVKLMNAELLTATPDGKVLYQSVLDYANGKTEIN